MRIVTYNVNSIRARLERLTAFLARESPDVVLLQETKVTDDEFPQEALGALGYEALIFGQRTYNGVAILSRQPLTPVVRGFPDHPDPQARLLGAQIGPVEVLSVYVPNGQEVGCEAYAYKLDWLGRLRNLVAERLAGGAALVLGGDWNVAPTDQDVHDPEAWREQVLCSTAERTALRSVVDAGLVDVFRQCHPDQRTFTWWDYRQLAFPKNRGLRIDYFLVSPSLAGRCTKAAVHRDERKGAKPSDHAPVEIELAV